MITFVYFDLGGVVEIDFSGNNKWKEMKKDLGITSEKEQVFDNMWDRYEGEVCVGRDVETLIPIFKKELGLKFPENYSLLDDFAKRFEANKSIRPVAAQDFGWKTFLYDSAHPEASSQKLLLLWRSLVR